MSQRGAADNQTKPGRAATEVVGLYWQLTGDTFTPVDRSDATHVFDDEGGDTLAMTAIDSSTNPVRTVRRGDVYYIG